MAKVTIKVEQDNGTTIEMKGDIHGSTVISKGPYTGSGDLLTAITTYIQNLVAMAS